MHDGLEDKACLLTTDTGNAGSNPHVARRFFNDLINELRYCSIDYITKIASVMM